jgi:amidase
MHDGRADGIAKSGLSRRELLQVGAAGAAALTAAVGRRALAAPPPFADLAVEEATVAELQRAMTEGRTTAAGLVAAYRARIERLDAELSSVIELNPDAEDIAAELDGERRSIHVRGPLHGIPVLIKDNIATADAMQTTAGSLSLLGARPSRDAFVAARLRTAGAVILGKTNLSEWANFRSTRSSSGWSGRGGQCRNPYALDRSPCGSSSGSGAAVAASLCGVAVGTETDGSIVCPSATNGVVGIKPTVGLVSRSGIVPISHTQDTTGPMARTVADAALLLGAMTGADSRDAATAASAGKAAADYTPFLDRAGLSGARIGVPRAKFFGYSPATDAVIAAAIGAMKGLGAVIVDPADIPHAGEFDDDELTVLLYEFKADVDAYLAALAPSGPRRTLADLIAFNASHRDAELPYFGQELFEQAQAKGPLTDETYLKALAKCRRLSRTEGIDAVMDAHHLDALVAPTGGPAWPIDLVNGDHFVGSSSTPAAVAGYPSVTVPAGFVFGLPVGLSFIGRAWSEGVLIRLAYAFEQGTKARRPPRYLPTADLTVG